MLLKKNESMKEIPWYLAKLERSLICLVTKKSMLASTKEELPSCPSHMKSSSTWTFDNFLLSISPVYLGLYTLLRKQFLRYAAKRFLSFSRSFRIRKETESGEVMK